MPQLDFTWWIINFFLIWTSVAAVISIMTANVPAVNEEQESATTHIVKNTTEWQWS